MGPWYDINRRVSLRANLFIIQRKRILKKYTKYTSFLSFFLFFRIDKNKIRRRNENRDRTYLEGTMVRMMGMMKLRCVNHVAGLRILAPRRLRDLDAARAAYNRRLVVLCFARRFFDAIFFLLLHFRFRFLYIFIYTWYSITFSLTINRSRLKLFECTLN